MHGGASKRIQSAMVPVLVLLSQLSLSPTRVVTMTTPDGEASCFVALPASGRVRMFQPHAASVWLLEKSERLVLTEGTSRVSIFDAATKRWSERQYVVHRERQVGALKRSVPRACVAVESRETMEKPTVAPPYCEAKWTAEGEHELEVPLGEACTVTIDGISRVAV